MIYLNMGNRWEDEFLDKVIELNKKYKKNSIRVSELYGNHTNETLPGVRPQARLNFGRPANFNEYVKKAKDAGITINYTFNLSCIGNLITSDSFFRDIQMEIETLEKIGVGRFTVYSPYILTYFKFKKKLEISTIHNNTNINYIIGTTTLNSNIDKVCLPIYLNRNFQRLFKLVPILKMNKVKPELILNEFCTSHQNTCVYRAECYNLQSHNLNIAYPFNKCSEERRKNPSMWLKAPFILPQWLDYYVAVTEINHFKLTGRTLPTERVLKVLEFYMQKYCDIPLEQLWGASLPYNTLETRETIYTGGMSVNFLSAPQLRYCENSHCGVTCRFCDNIWDSLKNRMNEE